LVARKKNEASVSKDMLLAAMQTAGTPAATVNAAAPLIAEQLVVANLIAVFYGDQTVKLVEAASRVYEELVRLSGFKLGLRAWHDPLYTATNLQRLVEKSLEVKNALQPETKQASLHLAKFLQRMGKIEEELDGEKIVYRLPDARIVGYLGEHAFNGAGEFFVREARRLGRSEKRFPRVLLAEAKIKNSQARTLAGEALQSDHPFEVMQLIDDSLSFHGASQFDLRYREAMLGVEELQLDQTGQDVLALTSKASEAAKRAALSQDVAGSLRRRRNSEEVAIIVAQANGLNSFSIALEQRIASLLDMPEIAILDETDSNSNYGEVSV